MTRHLAWRAAPLAAGAVWGLAIWTAGTVLLNTVHSRLNRRADRDGPRMIAWVAAQWADDPTNPTP